jgi:hypothetical protein
MLVILVFIYEIIRLPLPRPPHCSTLASTNSWSLSTELYQYACKRNELTTGRMLEVKPWSSKYMWRDSFRNLSAAVCNSRILFQNFPYSLTANSIKGVVLEKLRVGQVDKISLTLLDLNFHYSFQNNPWLKYLQGKVHSAQVVFLYQQYWCYLPVVELWINTVFLQFYHIITSCWNTVCVCRTDTIN